ncbi:MAG: class IV adenylate cyclase [Planctomycetaceae bacterium]|nr:class IV adenylate cyclase [Planctomycetaceae bacterium]
MHEIEAKIRVGDFEDVITRLKASGAKSLRQVRETDVYLDAQGQLLAKGCGMRIRRQVCGQTEKSLITYKGARQASRYKSRPEYEVDVSSAQVVEEIFAELGYTPLVRVEKKRGIWKLDDCLVCLDEVMQLGRFVEVEGPDENAIEAALNKIGLGQEPHVHEGYAEMMTRLHK